MKTFAEKIQVVPLRVPAVSTASFSSAHVKMLNVQSLAFYVLWGAMGGAATSTYAFKPRSAAANTTAVGDTALPFQYRLSSAVGADLWGAITTVAADTAVTVTEAQPDRALWIEIDPATIPGLDADGAYCYLDCVANGDGATDANYAMTVTAFIAPRYPQNTNLGTT